MFRANLNIFHYTETFKYEYNLILIMKELKDLTTIEQEVLLTFCDANNFSLGSHVPLEAVARRLRNLSSKLTKKTIKTLLSNGFIMKHPTRHNITYQLSKKGLQAGNQIESEF